MKRRQQEAEQAKKKQKQEESDNQIPQKEPEWRRGHGENETHNEAHATGEEHLDDESEGREKDQEQRPQDKYSPRELSLLRLLQSESNYMKTLKENDGKVESLGDLAKEQEMSINEDDQFTPDNWIPRFSHLIRLTGKHPLNGESELQALYEAGLITPNSLHFVRNHGPVPHLLWETHQLEVEGGKLASLTDDLANNYEAINNAVALACDGNRRKELNMIRRLKGFNWGAGAISCTFWKGPLLRDVLLATGIQDPDPRHVKRPR